MFVKLIEHYNRDEYEFTLRETKTYEIIDDVKNFEVKLEYYILMILIKRSLISSYAKGI